MATLPERDQHDAAPKACPACQSTAIVTASKTVTASSYWRCERCGEIWNVERRQPETPYFRRR